MTSGQGGQPPQEPGGQQPGQGWQQPGQEWGPPQGQPGQGWGPPQGQQPDQGWGNPQQGWQQPDQGWGNPQQGWQQPGQGGYGPAPSAPGPGPEPAPPRPDTVRFGVGAFIASLILGLVGSIVVFSSFDSLVAEEVARSGEDLPEGAVEAVLAITAVIGLLFVALQVLFIWFAWKGRNWARIVLFVLGGLVIVSGLSALTQPSTGFLTALSVFQMVLAVAGVVLLARRQSSDWYAAMGRRRAAGQR